MRPNAAATRNVRAPQRFDDEFVDDYCKRPKKSRGSSGRSSLDGAASNSTSPKSSNSARMGRRLKRASEKFGQERSQASVVAHAYRVANSGWYYAQKNDPMKRRRTPSPSKPPKRPHQVQQKTLLEAVERYVLPMDRKKPIWKQTHDQALQDAKLRARSSLERKIHDIEFPNTSPLSRRSSSISTESTESVVSLDYNDKIHLSIYDRQRDYLKWHSTYGEVFSGAMADMEDDDKRGRKQTCQDHRDNLEFHPAGLKRDFAALHPSLQTTIIKEIVAEAKEQKLPFYDANADFMAKPESWLGCQMDRSFCPREQDFGSTASATAELAALMSLATTSSSKPVKPSDKRHDSHEILVSHTSPDLSPKKRRLGRPKRPDTSPSRTTTTTETAASMSQITSSQSQREEREIWWRSFEQHDPGVAGRQYYPADQLFGMSPAQVEEVIARHLRDYRDDPEKAPTEGDVAKAEEFLRVYELPGRWIDMWLAESG